MGIIENLRQKIRGCPEDTPNAEVMMLLQSLRSCQPSAYCEEAENVMSSREISIQDSVISRADVRIENIENLILEAPSVKEDAAVEEFMVELLRTQLDYQDVLDKLEEHSQLTRSLRGEVKTYQMLTSLESSGIAPSSINEFKKEITDLEKECDNLHYSIRKRRDSIDGMRKRYGSLIQAVRDLRKPSGKIELNPRQREVVERGDGPMLVTAGPGSGKTTVLEERAVRLVKEGCNSERILILTFTVKAANAIRNRLSENEDIPTTEPMVFNFHGFCFKLVKEYHKKLGFDSPPELLKDELGDFYIKNHIDEILESGSLSLEMVSVPKFTKKLNEFNGLLHDRGCDPTDLLKKLGKWKEGESERSDTDIIDSVVNRSSIEPDIGSYLHALIALRKILQKDGFITYGDQITLALRLLNDNPEIAEEVCNHYRHLMVDEFQDDNWPQGKLVELMGGKMESVCVVGDLDQAIYGFRGANVRNTEEFRNSFKERPDFHSVELETGYRYSQELTEIAEKYIADTPGRPGRKSLNSGIPSQITTRIDCINTPDEVTEANEIAKRIQLLIGAGYRPEEIAVLAYSLNYLKYLTNALEQRGVPYTTTGQRRLFYDTIIRDGAMLMRAVLAHPNQEMAVRYCMSIPEFCINNSDRLKLNNTAGEGNVLDILEDPPSNLKNLGKATDFAKFLIEHRRDKFDRTRRWVQELFRDSGLARRLLAQPAGSPSFLAFEQLTTILEEFGDAKHNDQQLADFLDFLQEKDYVNGLIDEDPHRKEAAVLLSTIHRAKGLEFPVVFLPQLASRKLKSEDSMRTEILNAIAPEENQKEEMERERRRLYFVAMTRAMDRLILSRPKNLRSTDGTLRPRKAADFLNEILDAGRGIIRKVDVIEPVPEFGGTPLILHNELFRELSLSLSSSLSHLDRDDVEGDIKNSIRHLIEMKLAIAGADGIVLDDATNELLDQMAELVGGFSMEEISAVEEQSGPSPEVDLQLSYSAISDYDACPLKFRYRHIEGIKPPPKDVMISGSNIHRILEEFTKRHHPDGNLDQLMEIFDEMWATRRYASSKIMESEKLRCREIVNRWFEKQKRTDIPLEVEVEKKFRMEIEDMKIIGFVDRVEKYEGGRHELVDFKTGSSDKRPISSPQLFLYYHGSVEDWGETPTDLVIYNLVSGKRIGLGKKMRPNLLEKKKLEMKASIRRIKQRRYEPDTSHCRWCDFRYFCDYAIKPPSPTGKITIADSLVSETKIEKNAVVEGEVLKRKPEETD